MPTYLPTYLPTYFKHNSEEDSASLEPDTMGPVTSLGVSNKTEGLRFEKLSSERRRHLDETSAATYGLAAVWSNESTPWLGSRRWLSESGSGSSTIHDSSASFSLALSGDPAEVFVYSVSYVTSEMLLTGDPALSDATLLARLQPTLLAYIGSAWTKASATCNPEVVHYMEPGIYKASVCAR